jgi:hypothetical protein
LGRKVTVWVRPCDEYDSAGVSCGAPSAHRQLGLPQRRRRVISDPRTRRGVRRRANDDILRTLQSVCANTDRPRMLEGATQVVEIDRARPQLPHRPVILRPETAKLQMTLASGNQPMNRVGCPVRLVRPSPIESWMRALTGRVAPLPGPSSRTRPSLRCRMRTHEFRDLAGVRRRSLEPQSGRSR